MSLAIWISENKQKWTLTGGFDNFSNQVVTDDLVTNPDAVPNNKGIPTAIEGFCGKLKNYKDLN